MELSAHFTSCVHSLLKLVTLFCYVLNVTKNSNMFLFDTQYSNFAIVPFYLSIVPFLGETKIEISEILVVK